MRKIITLGIMLLFLGMTISSTTGIYLEKQTIKPMSFSNILYVGGNGTGNYSKIQDAIGDASDGDTVYVYDDSSPYYEQIIVNKSITLEGEDKETTIIEGKGDGNVIDVSSDNVKINGFTIKHSIWYLPNNGIYGCSNNNQIFDNIFTQTQYSIFLENSSGNNISGNYFVGNSWSIIIKSSSKNTISQNYMERISQNIMEVNNGIAIYNASENIISGNSILNSNFGITVEKTCDTTITFNTITNIHWGLLIIASDNINISKNIIEECNGAGIQLISSINTKITCNNFIANDRHATFHESLLWKIREGLPLFGVNQWDRNYWNRPRFAPNPIWGGLGIIFGDFQFHIPLNWFVFDWHPASEPYDIEV